jgi:hypothetical protein
VRWSGGSEQWQRPNVHGGDTLRCERGGKDGGVGCGKVRRSRGTVYRCGEGSERRGDDGRWCALKGAIDGVCFYHEDGGQ